VAASSPEAPTPWTDLPETDDALADDTTAEATPTDNGDQPTKTRAGLARRATRAIRRARSIYESNDWKESPEAALLIQEATVFALMDLAEAVREGRADSDAS
jgi:hypothetical protein